MSTDAEYRQFLDQCESQAAADFDKAAVSLAGGALGISLAFLKDIAPEPRIWSVWLLLAPAWTCLVAALLLIFISFRTSAQSMRYEIECLDGRHKKPADERAGGKFRERTEFCNRWTVVTCVAGLALLFAFAVVNVGRRVEVAKPPQTTRIQSPTEQRGRVTPDRPTRPTSTPVTVDPARPTGAGRVTPDRPATPTPASPGKKK